MPEEICLSTWEEKVEKSQNYCCFQLAGLTCEHVGGVCRCIYIQHVHAQTWLWLGWRVRGCIGGSARAVHDVLVPYDHWLPWHKDPPTLWSIWVLPGQADQRQRWLTMSRHVSCLHSKKNKIKFILYRSFLNKIYFMLLVKIVVCKLSS